MNPLHILRSAFMSGICIGVAGFGFLALKSSDQYLAGCVIFAFALIAVVNYKLWLYIFSQINDIISVIFK